MEQTRPNSNQNLNPVLNSQQAQPNAQAGNNDTDEKVNGLYREMVQLKIQVGNLQSQVTTLSANNRVNQHKPPPSSTNVPGWVLAIERSERENFLNNGTSVGSQKLTKEQEREQQKQIKATMYLNNLNNVNRKHGFFG